MSSWYVLAALGFYPLCRGEPSCELCSPLFEEATLDLGGGKRLTIKARGTSAQNKYIQRARLNGKILKQPRFGHAEIARGGTLELVMGPRPNKAWGTQGAAD